MPLCYDINLSELCRLNFTLSDEIMPYLFYEFDHVYNDKFITAFLTENFIEIDSKSYICKYAILSDIVYKLIINGTYCDQDLL